MLSLRKRYAFRSGITAWLPPEDGITKQLPTIKFRDVEHGSGVTASDMLARLKESWVGRLYLEYFKKIPWTRKIAFAIWRKCFPIYHRFGSFWSSHVVSDWLPIVKMTDYLEGANILSVTVFDAVNVETPAPKATPAEDQTCLVSPHNNYLFPPIYVAQLSDAQVYGGTNLVFLHDKVICHDLYDFDRDYTSEESHGRHVIDTEKKRLSLVAKGDEKLVQIPAAAVFLDSCSPNYAHWLSEVLPRIAVFCSVKQYAKIPIIIDHGLHRNILESLALVVGNDREVITLPVNRGLIVGVLYVTSVSGYVPFERRSEKIASHSHGLFSPSAFELIRKRVLPYSEHLPHQDFPKNIYLRRNSKARKLTNGEEIEKIFVANGYVIVEPENLTFLQQATLFSQADNIIGPSGASLANMIFSTPNTNCQILIGKFHATSYWYWQNIACSCRNVVCYTFGKLANSAEGIHGDYSVDWSTINLMLRDKS